ncbi:hypothetical protein RJ639_018530 [Escallonia herrerae]|uniref:Uncharacterized protein n=1 Tax=Escallonia herrerae TaxID=1293975 RepID=A0AA89AKY9_9ASTE|nr:hypothetical protein RJ639_018530 [Escallonia herrerae]
MDSSSSPEDSPKCTSNQLVSNCLMALPLSTPPFTHNPLLFRPPHTTSVNKLPNNFQSLLTTATTTSYVVHKLQDSLASTAERCLQFLHIFASQNPLLSKVSSLSSEFHNFCRIHRRNYTSLNSLSNQNFAAILPGDSVAGVVVANGVLNFLNIYNTLLVVRLVLTWFPNSPPAIVSPLSTLCDPYLNIFRGLIPPLGGTLDLSPILAFLVLNALTSTATALPAELPSPGGPQEIPSQKKWKSRFASNSSKSSRKDS